MLRMMTQHSGIDLLDGWLIAGTFLNGNGQGSVVSSIKRDVCCKDVSAKEALNILVTPVGQRREMQVYRAQIGSPHTVNYSSQKSGVYFILFF